MKPNPDTFKQLILSKYPDGVTSDGTPYAKMDATTLTQKIVNKYPDGITSTGVKYSDYLPSERDQRIQQGLPVGHGVVPANPSLNQPEQPAEAQPSFLGNLVRGITKPFVQGAISVKDTVQDGLSTLQSAMKGGRVQNAVAQTITNSIPGSNLINQGLGMLNKNVPMATPEQPVKSNYYGDLYPWGYGKDINPENTPVRSMLNSIGQGADVGTNLATLGGGNIIAQEGKNLLKQGLLQTIKTGTKQGAVYGGSQGFASGLGEASQAPDIKTGIGNVLTDTASGVVGGGITGGILAPIGLAGSKAIKLANDLRNPTEQAVNDARNNIANTYKKTLPLTPTQQTKEGNLLEKTGDNIYTTLAKHNINLGSDNAQNQLQKVSEQFETATNAAKANENGYFNVNEIKQNAHNQINENLPSETARQTAKNKIDNEIDAIIKSNPNGVIKDVNGNTKVNSEIVERLRKTGNSWTPFNASDPEKVGQSAGYALSNATRDQVEKEGSFPAYREANSEWGKVLHAQEVLGKIEDSGKSFKVPGGLSGAISRRVLSGALGFHTGGIGGAILAEMGSEYGAKIMSNPELRTWFNRKIIENAGVKQTPEVIQKLSKEVSDYVKQSENRLRLPVPRSVGSAENPHLMGSETMTTYEKPALKINRQYYPNETKMLPAPSGRVDNAIPVLPSKNSFDYTGKQEIPSSGYKKPISSKPEMNPKLQSFYKRQAQTTAIRQKMK